MKGKLWLGLAVLLLLGVVAVSATEEEASLSPAEKTLKHRVTHTRKQDDDDDDDDDDALIERPLSDDLYDLDAKFDDELFRDDNDLTYKGELLSWSLVPCLY